MPRRGYACCNPAWILSHIKKYDKTSGTLLVPEQLLRLWTGAGSRLFWWKSAHTNTHPSIINANRNERLEVSDHSSMAAAAGRELDATTGAEEGRMKTPLVEITTNAELKRQFFSPSSHLGGHAHTIHIIVSGGKILTTPLGFTSVQIQWNSSLVFTLGREAGKT